MCEEELLDIILPSLSVRCFRKKNKKCGRKAQSVLRAKKREERRMFRILLERYALVLGKRGYSGPSAGLRLPMTLWREAVEMVSRGCRLALGFRPDSCIAFNLSADLVKRYSCHADVLPSLCYPWRVENGFALASC